MARRVDELPVAVPDLHPLVTVQPGVRLHDRVHEVTPVLVLRDLGQLLCGDAMVPIRVAQLLCMLLRIAVMVELFGSLLVDPDLAAGLGLQPPRHAVVVDMGVRDDQPFDVRRGAVARGKGGNHVLPAMIDLGVRQVQPGVDECDAVRVVQQISIDLIEPREGQGKGQPEYAG
jgi:hypothetical protein